MVQKTPAQIPWHVPVKVEDIPEAGRHFDLSADAATRAAVAAFAGLPAVEKLEASFDVTRRGRSGLQVKGEVHALVGQICVVSLDPVESTITEPIDLTFTEPPAGIVAATEPADEAAQDEPPEYLLDGGVDLGVLSVEFLILGIDPYPRKPGIDFVPPDAGSGDGGPFAALSRLKRGPGSKN